MDESRCLALCAALTALLIWVEERPKLDLTAAEPGERQKGPGKRWSVANVWVELFDDQWDAYNLPT